MVTTRLQKGQSLSGTRRSRLNHRSWRKRREEPKCDVCQQLLDMLLARTKQHTIQLGEPQTVVGQSTCKVHRDLFLHYLKVDLATTSIKRIEVYRGSKDRDIELTAIFPDGSQGYGEVSVPSKGWGLLTHRSLKYNEGKILVVNPKWIDTNQMRRWKEDCDKSHPAWCHDAYRIESLSSVGPEWLIDCWRNCLVVAQDTNPYIALSYVWGGVPMFKTQKANLEALQKPGALLLSDIKSQIPTSIRHAIALTSILRQRYLWVDSLCIVQDDDTSKHREIQKMAGIYTNATLTVILKYGDADHGIPGLRGISEARSYTQNVFKLGKGCQMTQAMWAKTPYHNSTWSTRAWTFQEGLLSGRRLTFQNQTVQWDCYCAGRLFEDFNSVTKDMDFALERYFRNALHEPFPDMCRLAELIEAYNTRELTYPEDAHDAISGILTSMTTSFFEGFLFGLPIMNLDMGLLWQPSTTVTLRQNRNASKVRLPSWSWVAWEGAIDRWPWQKANDHIKKTPNGWALQGAHTTERVMPLMQWYMYEIEKDGIGEKVLNKIAVTNTWLGAREKFLIGGASDLPPGWSRFEYTFSSHDFSGSYYRPDHGVELKWYYKHESSSEVEFWYPIPILSNDAILESKPYFPVISCWTERATLYGAEQISEYAESTIALRDQDGKWAGCLQLHEPLSESMQDGDGFIGPRNHAMVGFAFELACISAGYNFENLGLSNTLTEWKCPERPNRQPRAYMYYNVLWIIWDGNVASRRGIGRVEREMWEMQQREEFELVLG